MKMLDLCCGGGLAAAGYWLSGCFTEIVGIDKLDLSDRYPYDFIQGDAFALDYDFLSQFDFIHASPPCQWYSQLTPEWARDRHERLIPNAHRLLKAWGGPHVIENVGGSLLDLRPTMHLSGFDVGLPMLRNRYFHVYEAQLRHSLNEFQDDCSLNEFPGSLSSNEYQDDPSLNEYPAWNLSESIPRNSDKCDPGNSFMSIEVAINVHRGDASRADLIRAFGLDDISPHHLKNLSMEDMEQGIPPRMTKLIAQRMFSKVMIA